MFEQKVIGHRGVCGLAPENTAASFELAHQQHIDWVEFDVCLSADHQAVVFHDDRVDRCSNGEGLLQDFTLSQLQALDVGGWFDDAFAGERILTLNEVIDLMLTRNLCFNLELKIQPGVNWQPLIEQVVAVLSEANLQPDQVIVSCFYPEPLIEFHRQMPAIKTGILLDVQNEGWQQWASAVKAVSVHCNEKHLSNQLAQEVLDSGYLLLCYTVNEVERFKQLLNLGVHGVFSDVPKTLAESLSES